MKMTIQEYAAWKNISVDKVRKLIKAKKIGAYYCHKTHTHIIFYG